METYEIRTAEQAYQDMRDLYRYIARELKEPTIADKLLSKIDEGIQSLSTMPQRHNTLADERLGQQGIRRLSIENYFVFYVVDEPGQVVFVTRVMYARRDWINLLQYPNN